MRKLSIILTLILLCNACDSGENGAISGVYVANQGTFGQNNGSITVYNPETRTTVQDAIPNLSTLVQSLSFSDKMGYIVANTGNRLDIFDPSSHTRTAQIRNLNSPRYFVKSGNKGYISSLYADSVYVLNLSNNSINKRIKVGATPEGMALVGNQLFVANSGFGSGTTLSVINTVSDVLSTTVNLGCDNPRMVFADAEDEVWTLCLGNTVWNATYTQIISQTNAKVVVIDANTKTIRNTFSLDSQAGAAGSGQDAYYDSISKQFFVIQQNKVLIYDTATNSLKGTRTFASDAQISAVAYDGNTNLLYIGKLPLSNAYSSAGMVEIWQESTKSAEFSAGIIPTHITFSR